MTDANARRRAEDKFESIKARHADPAHTAHLPDGTVCNVCVVLAHVADAVAQAVQKKLEQHDGRDDGHSFCSGCWEALRREETT